MSENTPDTATVLLARIERHEVSIQAFSSYDPVRLRHDAGNAPKGPLSGLSVGVKDIIDTAYYPTAHGSPIYAGHHTPNDAACVTQLKAAGALCVGKTVTTEFAFFRDGPTVNPYDFSRTPGGSSSGSAAAVGAGMIDIGLASQTAASLTRPASYCGVVGFKPSYGRYAGAGIKGLAPSFDTLGTITPDVKTAVLADSVLKGPVPTASTVKSAVPKRVGVCRTPWWDQAEDSTRMALQKAGACLGGETTVEDVDLSVFKAAADLHVTIMSYEACQALGWEYAEQRALLSSQIVSLIEAGRAIDYATYRQALAEADRLRAQIADVFTRYDLLLAPAAPGEAPKKEDGTGSPIFSRIWTLLRLPTVTLPGFTGVNGLPVGIQLLGAFGEDESLLDYATWAETLFPARPIPSICVQDTGHE
ncbi:amidase [Gluconobacter sphaericus]|uniref:amidase n=1 Tax=Gluconobacter sphaericus TaxID=574987 RepID=UPI0019214905|nr:amidase [Gluconobacter sphaericus]MBS1085741.1 amidase [Gluconobacter sphaericus]MBS1100052.1 amidase [Gluconobacter sphaericus]QQX90326.1 amidase [Gluconobacter sphaericus]